MAGFLNIAWLVPIPTFLAFVAIILFLNRNKTVSALTAIFAAGLAWLIGWPIAFAAFTTDHFGEHPLYGELFRIPTGTSSLMVGYQVDPANALMLFMSSFLILMIFIYASGYMTFPPHLRPELYPVSYSQGRDPRYSRFMAYICLFATGMLGLIVSNSLITFFIFWEIMGLCSYLLIGFWYEKASARAAAIKAFVTTRIGDVLMFIGMMFLYFKSEPSSLQFNEILRLENLEHLAEQMVTVPLLGLTVPWIALIAVLIFFGTVGKSSQFPLHVWLPDAMEGPTPVSAMIHAATMVSAGVFLLVRMFPLYAVAGEVSPNTMTFVAFIGAFTALFASTIAVAQWDIKRVLAYSTISQLGYMVAALGAGAYVAALFHLITHAFFKALLFLGSGSVIHGVEHGFHHAHEPSHGEGSSHEDETVADPHAHDQVPALIPRPDGALDPHDPQDMRNMGGLLGRMPVTAWTFIIGGLALSGFPLVTAGFWSKDEILASTWYTGNTIVFWTLAAAAFLTAFYTARQIGLTFLGAPRSDGASHAPESVRTMTWPLILITPFAIALGWIGIPEHFPGIGGIVPNWLEHFLEPYIAYQEFHVAHPEFNIVPLATSLLVALGGLAVGFLVYGRGLAVGQIDPLRRLLGPIWVLFHRKYYVDELYQYTIIPFTLGLSKFLYWIDDLWVIDPIVDAIGRAGIWLGNVAAAIDLFVVDGAVNGAGWIADRMGRVLRNTQDGHVQVYLVVAVVTVTVWLLLKAMPIILTLV
ncbi:MAG TPA: proton-conducting transporter membrane subunit [Caldilineaceae bacterium]|nr:proton-conducting transporter membrane subunit [Caldilineaceae bacterium]